MSEHAWAAASLSPPRPSSDTPTSLTTTLAPCWARHTAISRPIPRPAPVPTATLPPSRMGGSLPAAPGPPAQGPECRPPADPPNGEGHVPVGFRDYARRGG